VTAVAKQRKTGAYLDFDNGGGGGGGIATRAKSSLVHGTHHESKYVGVPQYVRPGTQSLHTDSCSDASPHTRQRRNLHIRQAGARCRRLMMATRARLNNAGCH
jgi:hypothetical protein